MTVVEVLQLLVDPSHGKRPPETSYQLLPPASAADLQQLEEAVGTRLPAELCALYQLSNGIAEYLRVPADEDLLLIGYLLLPTEEASAENHRIRQQPQTPTEAALLVVAPTHVGGWFGYHRAELPAASAAIYAWLPIDDELVKVADSLPTFLLGWAEGRISI